MKSMFNTSIRNAIASGSFKLLFSKFHLNDPRKPQATSKLYYREKVMDCIKKHFAEARFELVAVQTAHTIKHTWDNTCQ